MRRVSADKKFERIVFEAYLREGWADETLMAMIQDRQYAALRRLVRQASSFGQVDQGAKGEWVLRDDILDAMDKWKRGTK